MGSGSWTSASYNTYTTSTRGMSADTFATSNCSTQDVFVSRRMADALNPKGVTRACHDSAEHPNTVPVILALDVTGSMGSAAVKVAQKLNEIMTNIYANNLVKDIEFCVMGIGDLDYDRAPVQMSQFESDIRIAEQLDQIYFEGGGGGNNYESYTAAWYMGARHTDLHCWKRGKKGLIITLGDELPNPCLDRRYIARYIGDNLQDDVNTADLYKEVLEKFDVYHFAVNDKHTCFDYHNHLGLSTAWTKLLGDHFDVVTLDNLSDKITKVVTEFATNGDSITINTSKMEATINENGEISW